MKAGRKSLKIIGEKITQYLGKGTLNKGECGENLDLELKYQ